MRPRQAGNFPRQPTSSAAASKTGHGRGAMPRDRVSWFVGRISLSVIRHHLVDAADYAIGENISLPEGPAGRHIWPLVGEVALELLLRRQVDPDRWKREAGRDVGQLVLIDRVEIDRHFVAEFDLEQSVSGGRKRIGGGEAGVDAGYNPRRVGRCQGLAVDSQ